MRLALLLLLVVTMGCEPITNPLHVELVKLDGSHEEVRSPV